MIILSKYKKLFFLVLDILLITLAVYLAFFLRFEGKIPIDQISNIRGLIILALLSSLPLFYFFKLYSFSPSFISAEELVALIKATGLSFLFSATVILIFRDEPMFIGFPRSTLLISYFLIFLFCGAIRFSKRISTQILRMIPSEDKLRTLIVGAGDMGEQILRNILKSVDNPYLPIGFIDDSPAKKGLSIHGLKVLGKIDDIPQLVKKHDIDSLIIAFPSAGSGMIKKAEKKGIEGGVMNIKYLPPIDELIDSADGTGIGALREIDMEDLLGRESILLDQKSVTNFIRGKRVLITGAAGSIGSELCRQIAKFDPSWLFMLDQDETGIFNISEELKNNFPNLFFKWVVADIQDKKDIEWIFHYFYPEVVFHAAAYKHVPLMEKIPEEAVKNNILGTENVAKASVDVGVEKFIFISTDKAVNPTSVMGATKRIGEMICQNFNEKEKTKFISVRFGNVLGSRGSAIPIFKEQISKGESIKITHKDMERYFMVTSEACLLVMQSGAIGRGGEVFVLDMGDPVKIIDLAKKLIKRSGFEPEKDIKIEYTVPRPGEKLFEEILTAEEGTLATKNKKIFTAKISKIDITKLYTGLKKLEKIVHSNVFDKVGKGKITEKKTIEALEKLRKEIKSIFKELIPSYKPAQT